MLHTIVLKYNLSPGDMPPTDTLRKSLEEFDFSQLENVKEKLLVELEDVLHSVIPRLMDVVLSVAVATDDAGAHDAAKEDQGAEEQVAKVFDDAVA